jgi:hypothetical protein
MRSSGSVRTSDLEKNDLVQAQAKGFEENPKLNERYRKTNSTRVGLTSLVR